MVNADDFGFTVDVNQGIVEAHRRGILTATTLMANGAAFEDALRLARDFCPLPADTMHDPHLRRFFLGVSCLWGFANLLNAGVTLWLLVSQSVSTYVVTRTAMSWTLTVVGIGVSVFWFTRMVRRREEHAHALLVAPVRV